MKFEIRLRGFVVIVRRNRLAQDAQSTFEFREIAVGHPRSRRFGCHNLQHRAQCHTLPDILRRESRNRGSDVRLAGYQTRMFQPLQGLARLYDTTIDKPRIHIANRLRWV